MPEILAMTIAFSKLLISWLITTVAVGVMAIIAQYLTDPESFLLAYAISGLYVIAINLLFWLPAVTYLHNKRKISLVSSIVSSVAASSLGYVFTVGALMLLAGVNGGRVVSVQSSGGPAAGYTDWTVGHIHYWPGVVLIAVFWGINGFLFWKIYRAVEVGS